MPRLMWCTYRECNDNEDGVCLFKGYCPHPGRYTEHFSSEERMREIIERAREKRKEKLEEIRKKIYGAAQE